MKREKVAILPALYDAGGDLTKQWYVRFSVVNPDTGRLNRYKIYTGLCSGGIQERTAAASKLIREYTAMLKSGWNPSLSEKFLYRDQLVYHNEHKEPVMRKRKENLNFWINSFIKSKESIVRRASIDHYKSKTRVFLEWVAKHKRGSLHPSLFTEKDADNFFLYLSADRHLMPRTYNCYRGFMRDLWSYFVKQKASPGNPFKAVGKLKTTKKTNSFFSMEQLRKIKALAGKKDPQLWTVELLMFYCFIRPKELRFLKIGDIDFNMRAITIREEISKNKKTQLVTIPEEVHAHLIALNWPSKNLQ